MLIDKKIEIFLAVAQAESFTRAARKLSFSQSVVSFHMDALEKEIAVNLFKRQGRTISLTPEGEILYRDAKRIAIDAKQVEDSFFAKSKTISNRISLAGDTLTCPYTLPWALAEFRKVHPNVRFAYKHLDQNTLINKLLEGDVDMALIGNNIQNRKIETQIWHKDNVVLVAAHDAAPDKIKIKDIVNYPLLWATSDRGLELLLTRSLFEVGIAIKDLDIFMEIENIPILKNSVHSGIGLAFLPRLAIANNLKYEMLKIVEVEGIKLERLTYMGIRKEKNPREIITKFQTFVKTNLLDKKANN